MNLKQILFGVAIFTACVAQAHDDGFYVKAGLGANLVDDIKIKSVAGTPFAGKTTVDAGIRFDVGAGYAFNKYLGAGIETGLLWNGLDKFNSVFGSLRNDGDIYQVPALATLTLKCPIGKWTPYVTAGAGGLFSYVSSQGVGLVPKSNADDFSGAFQLAGGLKYSVNEHTTLGLGYKYLSTFDDVEWNFSGINVKVDRVSNHSLVLSFSHRF